MPSTSLFLLSLLSFLCLPFLSAVAATRPDFVQNLSALYSASVDSFFPESALTSVEGLASFIASPPCNMSSSSSSSSSPLSLYDCGSLSAADCLATASFKDAAAEIRSVGAFLAESGAMDLDAGCVEKLAPALLVDFESRKKSCSPSLPKERRLPLTTSIGYGFLFVTIISFCSLGGAVVMPFIETRMYKKCLMWMVGLAVGTLSGSGLLHLMPHTFGMTPEEMGGLGYLHRASTIFAGIYLFLVTERVLRSAETWRKRQRELRHERRRHESADRKYDADAERSESPEAEIPPICSIKAQSVQTNEAAEMKVPHMKKGDHQARTPKHSESQQALKPLEDQVSPESFSDVLLRDAPNGVVPHGHAHHGHSHDAPTSGSDIATVAWMVIFGDGLHNFIDGLSIGAAFTESVLSGISISVAVVCEEFPHELGDFAILLNSGMKFKQALLYNFLSACMCYCGLIFGIILGDTTQSAQWIFAIAAGMFLYIALVDMVPELNQQAEEMIRSGSNTLLVVAIQHSGIIIGFVIMYLMAAYGGDIDFTKAD